MSDEAARVGGEMVFQPGMRVRLTPRGIQQGLAGSTTGEGVVTSVMYNKRLRIRRDGTKGIITYAPEFWRPIK